MAAKALGAAASAAKLLLNTMREDFSRRSVSSGRIHDTKITDTLADKALDILAGNSETALQGAEVKVRQVLSRPPEEFSFPYMREWVNDPSARNAIKAAALKRFDNKPSSDEDAIAARVFEQVSGEAAYVAQGYIDLACQFIMQTLSAHLSIGERTAMAFDRSRADEVLIAIDGLKEEIKEIGSVASATAVDSIPLSQIRQVQEVADHFVRSALELILKRRAFNEAHPVNDILPLAERVHQGDLSAASLPLRLSVMRETAAAFARKSKAPEAKKWLELVRQLDSTLDLRVDNARILICEGKSTPALEILREIDTSEARSMLLDALAKKEGPAVALEYLKTHRHEFSHLSPAGALTTALKAIEASDLDLADALLSTVTDQEALQFPAIWSVRATNRIALCLPPQSARSRRNL